ncbi:ABC transporter permease subunit [Magnetospirillum sp. 15-1]|uniref:ABC transporter permease n=1 Tax=Magnetospirillum sp. 15-1 TaxID=1979370 RepID=UPI001F5B69A1|nr:ABC transporter permease subunit [Magnetospirillum sp. 15-1]
MMGRAVVDRLGRLGRFVWSGWAGLTGMALFGALWQAGNERYGDFIMPAPLAVLSMGWALLGEPDTWRLAALTLGRAAQGFVLATFVGMAGGLAAGYSPATMRLSRPILTLLLGVPPIAWIVLAMIWFGSTNGTVVVTVVVACAPLIFVTTAEGAMTRDRGLDDMARVFGAGPLTRLWTIGLRHVAAFVFPSLTVSLGGAIKVAVMAELLLNIGGMGGALAVARSNLDVAGALAWILLAVAGLVTIEYLLLRPLHAELERWRDAARPWGVKR